MIEMHTAPLPETLTITELIQHTRREITSFQRRQGTDGGYGYELFRRAIVLQDDLAWSGIYELYHAVVGSWILSLARKPIGENLEALVNEAFAKFAHAIGTDSSTAEGRPRYVIITGRILREIGAWLSAFAWKTIGRGQALDLLDS